MYDSNLTQEIFMWAHLLGLFTTKGLHLDGYAGAMSLPFPQKSLEFLRPGRQTTSGHHHGLGPLLTSG